MAFRVGRIMLAELMRNLGGVGDATGVICAEVMKQEFVAKAGTYDVRHASFEVVDKSVLESLRVCLYDEAAEVVGN